MCSIDNERQFFHAYLDESEDAASGVYVVGGFVGKAAAWDELEAKWRRCLPLRITFFHATDCFTGNNQFRGMDIPQRVALLDRLTDVIASQDVYLIGYGIDARIYQGLAPKAKQNEFLGNKYAAPFGGAVEQACKAMGNIPGPQEVWKVLEQGENWGQCDFFIESNEYSASAARTIADMRSCADLWFRSRIGGDAYGAKSGSAGIPRLQIADLGAFLATKHISNAPEGRISWKTYYEKLRGAQHVYGTVLADEYSLRRLHETHEELKQEQAQGRQYWDDI
jgi:hypothetical protein